jgi:tRNA nucleotidyltransferase/poly(A) polymerase
VRDELLGRTPKDYDVATDARPEQVRALFGQRRTLAIGAAFGVIAIVGTKESGNVEVTTFRRDAEYADGRRPDSVAFTDAEEDARRRDFTMNALFYDPAEQRVIDFVGGREDLAKKIVRAVGDASQRFAEDKLRMLRGVRMAAVFGFELESATKAAIAASADAVTVVSPERIAQELRGMLGVRGQSRAAALLMEVGLAATVFPELPPLCELRDPATGADGWTVTVDLLRELESHAPLPFATAFAALLLEIGRAALADVPAAEQGAKLVGQIGRRLRLSNDEREATSWLVKHQFSLKQAANRPWSEVQPILAHPLAPELATIVAARRAVRQEPTADVDFVRAKLALPRQQLDPEPWVTGDDLVRLGMRPGRAFAELLRNLRAAQLDETVTTREAAVEMALRLAGRLDDPPADA